MKIKETICTELDTRGRVVRRTRTVDLIDSETNDDCINYDEYDGLRGIHQTSSKRIYEAIKDYYCSKEW